jgi:hypothetical protein
VGSKKLAVCVWVRGCYLCVELTKLVIEGGLAWFYLIQAVGSPIYIVRKAQQLCFIGFGFGENHSESAGVYRR